MPGYNEDGDALCHNEGCFRVEAMNWKCWKHLEEDEAADKAVSAALDAEPKAFCRNCETFQPARFVYQGGPEAGMCSSCRDLLHPFPEYD